MPPEFKRVPAVDKCFAMLELLARAGEPMRLSQMAKDLGFHKSTLFNLAYTLADVGILEKEDGKFSLGLGLYRLAKSSRGSSDLIGVVHPYLERICQETNLTVFLGKRFGLRAVILDKADSPVDLKISSDIGIRIPILAGAAGKALLCQLSPEELGQVLEQIPDKDFQRFTQSTRQGYRDLLEQTLNNGFATDHEEYIEGIRALAVPLGLRHPAAPLAIWAVGLKSQIKGDQDIAHFAELMQKAAQDIRASFMS